MKGNSKPKRTNRKSKPRRVGPDALSRFGHLMNTLTPTLTNMLKRFLLTLPLLMLTQCTPTRGTHHTAVPPLSPDPVAAQQSIPSPSSEEQLEFFNQALDQA
jgi:hypothetical protein